MSDACTPDLPPWGESQCRCVSPVTNMRCRRFAGHGGLHEVGLDHAWTSGPMLPPEDAL